MISERDCSLRVFSRSDSPCTVLVEGHKSMATVGRVHGSSSAKKGFVARVLSSDDSKGKGTDDEDPATMQAGEASLSHRKGRISHSLELPKQQSLKQVKDETSRSGSLTPPALNSPVTSARRRTTEAREPSDGGAVSPVVAQVLASADAMFVIEAWTARILHASPGALTALGLTSAYLLERTMLEVAEGLTQEDWKRAVGHLAARATRRVIIR